MAVTQEVGGRRGPGWEPTLISDDARSCIVHRDCRVSCGNPSIGGLADRRQQPVQSNRTFRNFGKPNRLESRIGMLYFAAVDKLWHRVWFLSIVVNDDVIETLIRLFVVVRA